MGGNGVPDSRQYTSTRLNTTEPLCIKLDTESTISVVAATKPGSRTSPGRLAFTLQKLDSRTFRLRRASAAVRPSAAVRGGEARRG